MKWDLKLIHDFYPSGLECHLLMSLPNTLAFVIIIRPMSISCMFVAAAPEASDMVAYLMALWKMMAMGLVWAYVMFLTYTFFCARDCAVMSL